MDGDGDEDSAHGQTEQSDGDGKYSRSAFERANISVANGGCGDEDHTLEEMRGCPVEGCPCGSEAGSLRPEEAFGTQKARCEAARAAASAVEMPKWGKGERGRKRGQSSR